VLRDLVNMGTPPGAPAPGEERARLDARIEDLSGMLDE
jgi:hypothetical protein